ncbi:site-specific integrase [soil metagenome]
MNEEQQTWHATPVQNLIRYTPSGTYFARFKVGGKLFRKSLKTTVFSVAKLRLPDVIKEHRGVNETKKATLAGKLLFQDALRTHRVRIDTDASLKPNSKAYWEKILDFIETTWEGSLTTDIRKYAETDLQAWFGAFASRYAPSVANNAISAIKAVFQIAIESGARFNNPATSLKRVKNRQKHLTLPTRAQFTAFLQAIESGASRDSKNSADLVRFLSYSGLRISEANNVVWSDVNFEAKQLRVRGDSVTGTKNSENRFVPIIPELEQQLRSLSLERKLESDEPVMKVRTCRRSMIRAAKIAGIHHLSHHDLRHFFATVCIESGVDIPTVSRWLGHKYCGALAMKVYGHIRDEHSATQAQKVAFHVQPQP